MVITVLDLLHRILKRFLYSLTTNEGKNDTMKLPIFRFSQKDLNIKIFLKY